MQVPPPGTCTWCAASRWSSSCFGPSQDKTQPGEKPSKSSCWCLRIWMLSEVKGQTHVLTNLWSTSNCNLFQQQDGVSQTLSLDHRGPLYRFYRPLVRLGQCVYWVVYRRGAKHGLDGAMQSGSQRDEAMMSHTAVQLCGTSALMNWAMLAKKNEEID